MAQPTDVDTKPYVEHHPTFGYRYIPGATHELPRPGGGKYHLQINSAGIRSDREYEPKKPPGITRRLIVCGDSMAAGQFVSNAQRFSELLERRHPGLEVINLALEGSGTDQQLLLYEHVGLTYEHDAVLLFPFLQNIRRNMVVAREAVDPKTGAKVLRPKPRYVLEGGKLVLENVPVPKELSAEAMQQHGGSDAPPSWKSRLKTRLSSMPMAGALKKLAYAVSPWEPFPEYKDAGSPEWQLMEAIILRFRDIARPRPLLVIPTFYSNYVRYRMARNYWDRFSSLARHDGISPIDLLPHFQKQGAEAVRCFQDPYDMHFSSFGNLVIADALGEELAVRGVVGG